MDKVTPLPPASLLRKLLAYDAETGLLLWLPRHVSMFQDGKQSAIAQCNSWNGRNAGRPALIERSIHGYLVGKIMGTSYKAHRIAWAIATGKEPRFIDHVNGVRDDNRLVNLRETDKLGNARNQKRHHTNRSGVSGVCRCSRSSTWRAYIRNGKKNIHLGVFKEFEDAVAARKQAETKLGYHINHGRGQ